MCNLVNVHTKNCLLNVYTNTGTDAIAGHPITKCK